MKHHIYHLILGGNLGDRMGQLVLTKELIGQEVGTIKKESGVYETQPWGFDDQPWFLNQVIEVSSSNPPDVVLRQLKNIEKKVGRTPSEKWHARHIDIDILFYGDMVMKENDLEIPHPLLHTRNFVLVPLMDLAPEFMHPILGKTVEDLYLDSRDKGEVYIFNPDEPENPI